MTTQTEALAQTIDCQQCGKTALIKKRAPTGWKRLGERYFCRICWQAQYTLRAIVFHVAAPIDLSWAELRAALKIMWAETTRASNWMVRELVLADVVRDPTQSKMPPMPRTYFYPEARVQFPSLPSTTVSSLEQAVTRKYKAIRYEVIWTCKSALPTFRYPQPFPVHNQSWTPAFHEDSPVVTVRLGDKRVGIRLMGGFRYRRQLAAFQAIVSGKAIPGECSIYAQGSDILVKLIAWLPRGRDAASNSRGVLRVRTTPDSLLAAFDEKDQKLWTYCADQIPRWSAEHRRQLQRWADDSKFEQRPIPLFAPRRHDASIRYHRRVNTAADQAAASLVGYAQRRKFAGIAYDDTERQFCPEFVWFRLAQRIQTLCDEHGIKFTIARGAAITEQGGSLNSL